MQQGRRGALPAILLFLAIAGGAFGLGQAKEGFDVNIKATEKAYAVGEPIELVVQGNGDFYLYLFAVDEAAEKPHLLTPADKEKMRKFKAKKRHHFPENGKSLVADASGMEKIVMLASTQPVKLPDNIAPRDAKALQSLRLVEGDGENQMCIKELDILIK